MATEHDAIWYFGYGSNMSPAIFVERRQMQPLESRIGYVEHFQVCFNLPVGAGERGVANLEAIEGARTWGVLHLVTSAEFERLDRTEGVHRGYYARAPIEVVVGETSLRAFTYRSPHGQPGRKPSARYLGLLLDGARHHGLPDEYVRFLESFELAWDERAGDKPAAGAD